jgi:hypothetical protein
MTTKKKTAAKKTTKTLRAVIVRAYSGVFFGHLVSKTGASVELRGARQVWSWDSAGLAEKAMTCGDIARIGVGSGSKIGGPADAVIEHVGAMFFASAEAERVIGGQKWATR